jgi:hypothetical protein
VTDLVQENGSAVLGSEAAPKPVVPEVVFHDRPVPLEWESRLREISPVSQEHSWLHLKWHPAVERWMVYEMVPQQYVDVGTRAELDGAHPHTLEEWARVITPWQWEAWRKHRCHARLAWIIQGNHGGHKVHFSEIDKELCRAVGLPSDPPAFGSLPYAPFDERVVRQLLAMNKLVQAKNDLAEFKRRWGNTDGFKRNYKKQLAEARERYVAFVNQQFADGDEHFADALRKGELEDAPRTELEYVKENEDADQKYIETGRF